MKPHISLAQLNGAYCCKKPSDSFLLFPLYLRVNIVAQLSEKPKSLVRIISVDTNTDTCGHSRWRIFLAVCIETVKTTRPTKCLQTSCSRTFEHRWIGNATYYSMWHHFIDEDREKTRPVSLVQRVYSKRNDASCRDNCKFFSPRWPRENWKAKR